MNPCHVALPVHEIRKRRPANPVKASLKGGVAADPFPECGLPREEFLERLRFEKRRTDRSGTPLSLAVFSLKEEPGGTSGP